MDTVALGVGFSPITLFYLANYHSSISSFSHLSSEIGKWSHLLLKYQDILTTICLPTVLCWTLAAFYVIDSLHSR
jgi:hypothetical protein